MESSGQQLGRPSPETDEVHERDSSTTSNHPLRLPEIILRRYTVRYTVPSLTESKVR